MPCEHGSQLIIICTKASDVNHAITVGLYGTMPIQKLKIGDILLKAGVINEEQLNQALKFSKEQREKGNPKRLGDCLRDMGFVTDRQVAEALAGQMNLKLVDLQGFTLSRDMINLIPGSTLRKHSVLPLAYDPNDPQAIFLAMADPLDIVAMDDVVIISNCRVEPCVATQTEIQAILDRYYGSEEAMSAADKFAKSRADRTQTEREEQEQAERDLRASSGWLPEMRRHGVLWPNRYL